VAGILARQPGGRSSSTVSSPRRAAWTLSRTT